MGAHQRDHRVLPADPALVGQPIGQGCAAARLDHRGLHIAQLQVVQHAVEGDHQPLGRRRRVVEHPVAD
jgi:hypothetical protein